MEWYHVWDLLQKIWEGGHRGNKNAQELILVEAEWYLRIHYIIAYFRTCLQCSRKKVWRCYWIAKHLLKVCVLFWKSGTGGAGIWEEEGLEQPLRGERQGMYEANRRVAELQQGPCWNWTAWIHTGLPGSPSSSVLGLGELEGGKRTVEAGVPETAALSLVWLGDNYWSGCSER